jgi:hypothetical protein
LGEIATDSAAPVGHGGKLAFELRNLGSVRVELRGQGLVLLNKYSDIELFLHDGLL